MGKHWDPFFDRDDLENMSDEEMLKKIKDAEKSLDEYNEQYPDPER